jgi:hypothetical protein
LVSVDNYYSLFIITVAIQQMAINEATGKRELYRQVTAMGTVGELGQLFTVYEKNWNCPDCDQENYASRSKCSRCKCNKPSKGNYVKNQALDALQTGKEITWKEAIDPSSYQL